MAKIYLGNGSNTFFDRGVRSTEIFGEGGSDQIFGLAGADILHGGDGDDTLNGGAGFDIASYEEAPAAITVNLSLDREVFADGYGNSDDLVSIEKVIGSNYGDTFTGNDAANQFDGLLGNDQIWGLGGNDKLNGGLGRDTILGGQGNDLIDGGQGNDTLRGGYGNDIIVTGTGYDSVHYDLTLDFDAATAIYDRGIDRVMDFVRGQDRIHADLRPATGGDSLHTEELFDLLDSSNDGKLGSNDAFVDFVMLDGKLSTMIDFGGLQEQVYDPNGIWGTGVATLTLYGVVGITESDFI